ncbi:metal-sensing transcriptional repressor [Pseudomonas aeruginosa]|jgi:DNA-binding FrmR family transcriptional regulator|uniref:metal-sensing transcriptional repressor n=1 Tax=Pseudomonas aeruginosa TaxID=287 RepID=UPI0008688D10|nr:metal-sensing transcriptional repressor [Pseudomonas aeruginosa]ODU26926.1 MAG: nickel resistance protein [Thiobacillus sp. SCN 62-729]
MTAHTIHPGVLTRLKRVQGHLKSILTMLEENRDCLAITQQLQAVEKAIGSAKRTLVYDHIEHCLESTVREGAENADETIREFKEITKYL